MQKFLLLFLFLLSTLPSYCEETISRKFADMTFINPFIATDNVTLMDKKI